MSNACYANLSVILSYYFGLSGHHVGDLFVSPMKHLFLVKSHTAPPNPPDSREIGTQCLHVEHLIVSRFRTFASGISVPFVEYPLWESNPAATEHP